jgi:NADH dehydrogenase [ubiquinone] 1 alpha subcomplex assembly factor 6
MSSGNALGQPVSGSGAQGLSHCALLVRSRQPERYLATLFAPAEAREALFALYAFDHETGKVRQLVSEPMAGLIRLQWWRDALAAAEPPAHPVVEALHRMLGAFPSERARLEDAIDARERELEGPPPADLAALEQHLGATSGALTEAALAVLGATGQAALAAGGRIGIVVGLAELLRALPADLARGRALLPAAELARHGLDAAALAALPTPESAARLDPVIVGLAARGVAHLQDARAMRAEVPRAALPALLPGTLAGAYLERLGRARHELLPRTRAGPSALAPLSLLWRHLAGRF